MLRYAQHDKLRAVTLSEAKGLARPEREMLRYAQHDSVRAVTLGEATGLARPEREMLRYAQHDKLRPLSPVTCSLPCYPFSATAGAAPRSHLKPPGIFPCFSSRPPAITVARSAMLFAATDCGAVITIGCPRCVP